ncbi:MAG: hypothetical protein ACTSRP_13785 [Candidatus Helarchaeota archaeon]
MALIYNISHLITYIPNFIYIAFLIVILVFSILHYKDTNNKYAIFFMLYSIFNIVSNFIAILIDYNFLIYNLEHYYGFTIATAAMISTMWGIFFTILSILTYIMLFLGIYKLYKSHKEF